MVKMDMTPFYREEDFFPREFTGVTERPWGFLYHDPDKPDSYDSNHALIFRDRVGDLSAALAEIVAFYRARDMKPILYQSILDDGWFGEIAPALSAAGFRSWQEEQRWMLLCAPSAIAPAPDIAVRRENAWQEAFAEHIFLAAGEPWEIPVARGQLARANTLFFAAWAEDKPVGAMYGHTNAEGICRVDYLLVAPAYRKRGIGRALAHAFATHCRTNGLPCALWPDGETPERIYEAAGFRHVAVRWAGRACMDN